MRWGLTFLCFAAASAAHAATIPLGNVVAGNDFGAPGTTYSISDSGLIGSFSDQISFNLPTPLPLPTNSLTPGHVYESIFLAFVRLHPANLSDLALNSNINGTVVFPPVLWEAYVLLNPHDHTFSLGGFANSPSGSYTADVYFAPDIIAVGTLPEASTWLMLLAGGALMAWRLAHRSGPAPLSRSV